MNTTAEFLAKFNDVTFTSASNDKVIGHYRNNEVKVSISTKIPESIVFHQMAVQVIMRVEVNGKYVMSWGSDSNECNMELVKWFKTAESKARNTEREQERFDEEHAKHVFDSL